MTADNYLAVPVENLKAFIQGTYNGFIGFREGCEALTDIGEIDLYAQKQRVDLHLSATESGCLLVTPGSVFIQSRLEC